MARYHISNATGKPAVCRAQPGNCPLAGEHFRTKDEANFYAETIATVTVEQEVMLEREAEQNEASRQRARKTFPRRFKDWAKSSTEYRVAGKSGAAAGSGQQATQKTAGRILAEASYDSESRSWTAPYDSVHSFLTDAEANAKDSSERAAYRKAQKSLFYNSALDSATGARSVNVKNTLTDLDEIYYEHPLHLEYDLFGTGERLP